MKSILISSIVLATLVSLPRPVRAQNPPYAYPDRAGEWAVSADESGMEDLRLSPAQRAAALENREIIYDIVRSARVFNPLKGIAVRARKSLWAPADAQGRPPAGPVGLRILFIIGHFVQDRETGRVAAMTTEMPRLEIVTNSIEQAAMHGAHTAFWYEPLYDEAGAQLYLKPEAVASTPGGLEIWRVGAWEYRLAITNGRQLWIPVSAEHFLRTMVADVERQYLKDEARLRAAGISKEQSFEMTRRRGFEEELAALSAAGRQAPAYWATPDENPMSSGLTSRNTPGARPVVRINPEYFDPSLPRSAVQLIGCQFHFNLPLDLDEARVHPELWRRTLYQLLMTLEYDRLASVVQRTRTAEPSGIEVPTSRPADGPGAGVLLRARR
jgi:hypothetical protein